MNTNATKFEQAANRHVNLDVLGQAVMQMLTHQVQSSIFGNFLASMSIKHSKEASPSCSFHFQDDTVCILLNKRSPILGAADHLQFACKACVPSPSEHSYLDTGCDLHSKLM